MSVDVLISPRISFSHDLRDSSYPCNSSSPALDAPVDFDFAFIVDSHGALIREPSTADQLFSDGKLLPISTSFNLLPCSETEEKKKKKKAKSLKEHLEDGIEIEAPPARVVSPAPASTAFWNFRRSNSLNRAKLNIPTKLRLLSRSKSTGFGASSSSAKPVKDGVKEPSPATESGRSFWRVRRSNSVIESLKVILLRSNSAGEALANGSQPEKEKRFGIRRSKSTGSDQINNGKKEMKKQKVTAVKKEKGEGRRSYYGNCSKSERANPVLNLPSPYISRVSVDLLGFGSLFGRSKSMKVNK